jgi:hypothetical protein
MAFLSIVSYLGGPRFQAMRRVLTAVGNFWRGRDGGRAREDSQCGAESDAIERK